MRATSRLAITAGTILVILSMLAACAPAATPTPPPPAKPTAGATAATGVATAAPAAAKPAAAGPTPTAAPKIKRGGTLRTAQADPYDSLDPHLAAGGASHVHGAVFDAPLRLDYNPATQKFIVNADVADSWQFENDTTLVLKIHPGIKFHDGSPLDAAAMKFNFDRLGTHKRSTGKDYVENIKETVVVDPLTVKLNLVGPSGAILGNLSGASAPMHLVSKAAVEKLGDEQFNLNLVGSGPFTMAKYVPDNVVNLKKNENYWKNGADGKPLPYLDGIDARNIVNTSVQLLEMKARTVDYVDLIEPKDVMTLKADTELVFLELNYAVMTIPLVGFNQFKPPFDKLEVRQAAQHAINREAISSSLGFGMTKPWYYVMWAPGVLGWDEKLPKYEYNPEKAKQLLAKAGYPNGVDVVLDTVQRDAEQRAGQMIQPLWNAVGLRTTYNIVERVALFAKMRGLEFQAAQWRANNYYDPDASWRRLTCDGGQNRSQLCDKELDKCLGDGRREMDQTKREGIYNRCLKIFQEGAYLATAYGIPVNRGIHKGVQGVRYQFTQDDFTEAWLDK